MLLRLWLSLSHALAMILRDACRYHLTHHTPFFLKKKKLAPELGAGQGSGVPSLLQELPGQSPNPVY